MSGDITKLTSDNFDDFVKEDTVVVYFWAEWCGPCKVMAPIFEEVAGELKGRAKLSKVDIDANSDLAQRFQVMSIPTMIFFRDGEQVDRISGALPKDELIKKVQEIK